MKLIRYTGVLAVALCSMSSVAADSPGRDPVFNGAYLLQVGGSLLLVLGILLGLAYLLKRVNGGAVTDQRSIRILSSVKVGTREKIMLLESGEQQLLVGVTGGGIRTLHVFGKEDGERSNVQAPEKNFASLLSSSASVEEGQ